jgi:alanyl-tRNA synthetase
MLGDGIVPSNVKAGYLVRLVIRKALRLAETIKLDIALEDIVRMQIEDQKAYPQYVEGLGTICDIIQHEARRYKSTIDKGKRLVKVLAEEYKGRVIPLDELIRLYDTHGVPPEIVTSVSKGEGVSVDLPDDFYALVAQTHDQLVIQEEVRAEHLLELPSTYRMFYDEPEMTEFEARVIDITDHFLILDKTLFYPEGGGQPEDTGSITSSSGVKVKMEDARLVGDVVLHKVSDASPFQVGEKITGKIDVERRMSHARHHTATHILLSAIKGKLGDHIWQEGAQKGENRSRLDVSHYKRIDVDEQNEIELKANEIVMKDLPVTTAWVDRNEAEQQYGFVLYQGGVPPGEVIRVVKVGTDVQACAGTHMTRTGKVGPIRIIKTEGIQDGIQRFEFAAGIAAILYDQDRDKLISETSQTLRVPSNKLPTTVKRFFNEWMDLQKETDNLKKKNAQLRSVIIKAPPTIAGVKEVTPEFKIDADIITINKDEEVTIDNTKIKILAPRRIRDADIKELLKTSQELLTDDNILILGGTHSGRANVVIAAGKNVIKRGFKSSEAIKEPSVILGGGGGGRPERAQGGGQNIDKIDEALILSQKRTKEQLESLKRES